jgi:hypothetical protein
MLQALPEPVKPADDEGVARLGGLETSSKAKDGHCARKIERSSRMQPRASS